MKLSELTNGSTPGPIPCWLACRNASGHNFVLAWDAMLDAELVVDALLQWQVLGLLTPTEVMEILMKVSETSLAGLHDASQQS